MKILSIRAVAGAVLATGLLFWVVDITSAQFVFEGQHRKIAS